MQVLLSVLLLGKRVVLGHVLTPLLVWLLWVALSPLLLLGSVFDSCSVELCSGGLGDCSGSSVVVTVSSLRLPLNFPSTMM